MNKIIEKIIIQKRQYIADIKKKYSLNEYDNIDLLEKNSKLRKTISQIPFIFIPEIKPKSPTQIINDKIDCNKILKIYSMFGSIKIISVLTDPFFGMDIDKFKILRQKTTKLLLRKDFIIDKIQVIESYQSGADVNLIILGLLNKKIIQQLYKQIRLFGMEVLFEINDKSDIEKLPDDALLVGINNRNILTDFSIDTNKIFRLSKQLQDKKIKLISLSGITTTQQFQAIRYKSYINGLLIGTGLLKNKSKNLDLYNTLRKYNEYI